MNNNLLSIEKTLTNIENPFHRKNRGLRAARHRTVIAGFTVSGSAMSVTVWAERDSVYLYRYLKRYPDKPLSNNKLSKYYMCTSKMTPLQTIEMAIFTSFGTSGSLFARFIEIAIRINIWKL